MKIDAFQQPIKNGEILEGLIYDCPSYMTILLFSLAGGGGGGEGGSEGYE